MIRTDCPSSEYVSISKMSTAPYHSNNHFLNRNVSALATTKASQKNTNFPIFSGCHNINDTDNSYLISELNTDVNYSNQNNNAIKVSDVSSRSKRYSQG